MAAVLLMAPPTLSSAGIATGLGTLSPRSARVLRSGSGVRAAAAKVRAPATAATQMTALHRGERGCPSGNRKKTKGRRPIAAKRMPADQEM